MFRAPPVTRAISSFNAAMLSGFVTSSMKVSIPSSSRLDTAFFDRAVANVRKPRAANSKARALPALPFEQLLWGKEALAKHVYAKGYRRTMIYLPCYKDSRRRRIVQLKSHHKYASNEDGWRSLRRIRDKILIPKLCSYRDVRCPTTHITQASFILSPIA